LSAEAYFVERRVVSGEDDLIVVEMDAAESTPALVSGVGLKNETAVTVIRKIARPPADSRTVRQ
jgi:hypothetical protein